MHRIVLDVETAGNVDDRKSLRVYDMGFVVLDDKLNIVEQHSWIIADVYYGMANLMKTAYYADKLDTYYEPAIRAGEMTVKRFLDAKVDFHAICKKYHVKKIYAFNATFDRSALDATLEALSHGFCKFFTPYGIKWGCIQRQAVQDICTKVKYFDFCIKHGFVSEKGNVRTNAETVYAYLSDNSAFVEQHTGLQDVMIETEILRKCLKLKSKLHDEPTFSAWREPQNKFQEYVKRYEESVKN